MDPEQQLRNLRDFLLVYNRMTESCFLRCSSNFNYRNLTMDEERCVDNCAGKMIRTNHRLMGTYVQLMPKMVQRRMEEMESKMQSAKVPEAAASADFASPAPEAIAASENPDASSLATAVPPLLTPPVVDVGSEARGVASPATEAIAASENPVASSLATAVPPPLTQSVVDVRSEARGSFVAPTGLDTPVELDNHPVSNYTTTPEVKLPAATTLTDVSEAVYPSVPSDTGGGPSYGTGSPLSPIAGALTEFESSVPVLVPSKPTSTSADRPVSTAAAPTLSTESLSAREIAPELPPTSNQ